VEFFGGEQMTSEESEGEPAACRFAHGQSTEVASSAPASATLSLVDAERGRSGDERTERRAKGLAVGVCDANRRLYEHGGE
jgi:hypothetical protein